MEGCFRDSYRPIHPTWDSVNKGDGINLRTGPPLQMGQHVQITLYACIRIFVMSPASQEAVANDVDTSPNPRIRLSKGSDWSGSSEPHAVLVTPSDSPVGPHRASRIAASVVRSQTFADFATVVEVQDDSRARGKLLAAIKYAMSRVYPEVSASEAEVKLKILKALHEIVPDSDEMDKLRPRLLLAAETSLATDIGGLPGHVPFDQAAVNLYLKDMYAKAGRSNGKL